MHCTHTSRLLHVAQSEVSHAGKTHASSNTFEMLEKGMWGNINKFTPGTILTNRFLYFKGESGRECHVLNGSNGYE